MEELTDAGELLVLRFSWLGIGSGCFGLLGGLVCWLGGHFGFAVSERENKL